METFATLGDMLLRRYVVDFIGQMQQLSTPIYSMLKEDSRFTPSGDGAYFAVRLHGNEAGGAWRGTDDNSLPSASNETIKQVLDAMPIGARLVEDVTPLFRSR